MSIVYFEYFKASILMKRYLALILIIVITLTESRAQLLPSIGLTQLPADADSICPIPIAQGNSGVPGINPGNSVPDFKLYTLNGDSVILSDILQQGKPVLLISASYTCPVFRGKIQTINMVDSIYQGQLSVYVIYTVEAHPIIDVSPYSGNVWTTSTNQTEGVLYEQPKTYGERKVVLNELLNNYYLRPMLLIDGPCNDWWLNYGTEPNSATLIKTDGKVFAFQQWFDKTPDNIFCEIDSLLGTNSGLCTSVGNGGNFTWAGDTIDYGIPGYFIAIHSTLTNTSSTDNVEISILRQGTQMPATWQTALCTDVCYPPGVNSASVTLAPGVVQPFIFYFYTDSIAATGMAQVRFVNQGNVNNVITKRFYSSTMSTSINEKNDQENLVEVFPNPANDFIKISAKDDFDELNIYDIHGRFLIKYAFSHFSETLVTLESFPAGIYLVELIGKKREMRKIVKE